MPYSRCPVSVIVRYFLDNKYKFHGNSLVNPCHWANQSESLMVANPIGGISRNCSYMTTCQIQSTGEGSGKFGIYVHFLLNNVCKYR